MASKKVRKTRSSPVRTILGALSLGALWFVTGWLMASTTLGIVLAVWSFAIAPWVLPPLFWAWYRLRGRLQVLDLRRESVIAAAYFESIVEDAGPQPRVWVLGSKDPACFWFETLTRRSQELIVTTAWLEQNPARRTRDWKLLWNQMSSHPRWRRLFRTAQIAWWVGLLSPVELLLWLMNHLFRFLGYREVPTPAFWLQRNAWNLKQVWFGTARDEGQFMEPQEGASLAEAPSFWNSLIWGPWFQVAEGCVHPAWRVLTHSGAYLSGSPAGDKLSS